MKQTNRRVFMMQVALGGTALAAQQALAQAMDGQITDDNGQVLSEAAIQIIDNDLKNLYQALAARDLAAGSLQARRLFS